MRTQGFSSQFEGRDAGDPAAEGPVVEWLVVEPLRPIHAAKGAPRGPWGLLALITFFVGAAFGWSADRTAMTPPAAQTANAPQTAEASHAVGAPMLPRSRIQAPGHRSLFVVIPADRDYVSSSSIAVAGMAFGRPHGPRIRAVHVELFVGGRLIDRADLEVFSARFAGVVELRTPIARAEAELRISDPTRPAGRAVVRRFTIDAPATPLDPSA